MRGAALDPGQGDREGEPARPARSAGAPCAGSQGGRLATQVYARDGLRPGHVIRGPAMVDGPDTSYAVAPGWRLAVDDFSNFVLTRSEG